MLPLLLRLLSPSSLFTVPEVVYSLRSCICFYLGIHLMRVFILAVLSELKQIRRYMKSVFWDLEMFLINQRLVLTIEC